MNDIDSADLLSRVVHRFGQHVAPQVRLIGPPLWLHVDSQLVPLLVEHVIEQLYTCGAGYEFEIECLPGNRRVYLDIIWQGRPISIHRIREWSEQRLQDRVGAALVTHHAALKMKFLKLKAKQAGIRFDNPVLDTLLLST